MLIHRRVTPSPPPPSQYSICQYPFILLGGKKHCASLISVLPKNTEGHSTMSLASTRTQTPHSGVEFTNPGALDGLLTNHESTGPPTSLSGSKIDFSNTASRHYFLFHPAIPPQQTFASRSRPVNPSCYGLCYLQKKSERRLFQNVFNNYSRVLNLVFSKKWNQFHENRHIMGYVPP